MGNTNFPLMYGVWHTEDKTWISFTTSSSEAYGMVRDFGDHLEVRTVKVAVDAEVDYKNTHSFDNFRVDL